MRSNITLEDERRQETEDNIMGTFSIKLHSLLTSSIPAALLLTKMPFNKIVMKLIPHRFTLLSGCLHTNFAGVKDNLDQAYHNIIS